MTVLRVALLGLGNIGTGVAMLLLDQSARVARRAGRPIELRRVIVRDLRKARSVQLPSGIISDDPRHVIEAPEIDVAIELMGGVIPTFEIFRQLLESGKDVVTANKA